VQKDLGRLGADDGEDADGNGCELAEELDEFEMGFGFAFGGGRGDEEPCPEILQPLFVCFRSDLENSDGGLGIDGDWLSCWIAIEKEFRFQSDGDGGENFVAACTSADPFADLCDPVRTDLAEEGECFHHFCEALHVGGPGLRDEAFEKRVPLSGAGIFFCPEEREADAIRAATDYFCLGGDAAGGVGVEGAFALQGESDDCFGLPALVGDEIKAGGTDVANHALREL